MDDPTTEAQALLLKIKGAEGRPGGALHIGPIHPLQ